MPKEIKGKKETESTPIVKNLMVNFKGSKKKYEFDRAFVCGFDKDSGEGEISTIINGFSEIQDFVMVYNNIILQAFDFLYNNGENSKEDVVTALKTSSDGIFNGILEGRFEEYFNNEQSRNI